MANKITDFHKYAGEVISGRMDEFGLSQYKFMNVCKDVTHPTFRKILRGKGGNIGSLVAVCDALGLEITIKPKKDGIDYKEKFFD